jgi:chemotaxis protein MotB
LLARRHRDAEDDENLERWLLTYADLITLLLAFFIVLYSISRIDAGKFNKVSDALTTAFRAQTDGPGLAKDISSEFLINKQLRRGNLGVLKDQIDKISQQINLGTQLKTELQPRGLVIRISESAIFDPGKAELKPQAKKMLDLISIQLLKIPNHIRVEGHTDSLPISNERFKSNWELSTSRATECLRYLIEKHGFPPERIAALGYAEFRPIAPNTTVEGRAKNRRVDIIVLNLEDSHLEPEKFGNATQTNPTEEGEGIRELEASPGHL